MTGQTIPKDVLLPSLPGGTPPVAPPLRDALLSWHVNSVLLSVDEEL